MTEYEKVGMEADLGDESRELEAGCGLGGTFRPLKGFRVLH